MSLRPPITFFALALVVGACGTRASTKDSFLAGTADTAYAVKQGSEAVFWQFPRFLFWTVPRTIAYDLPRSVALSLSGRRAKVEALAERLNNGNLTPEEEVTVCDELRELTGIPIHSADRFKEWWAANRNRPESAWKRAFAEEAVSHLEDPGYFERASAIEDLKALYGTDLGYDPKGSPKSIAAGAARWRARLRSDDVPANASSGGGG